MGKQLIPILLAFVLGFGLGYVYHSQATPAPGAETPTSGEADLSSSGKALATQFQLVDTARAKIHVKKYKDKHPKEEDPKYYTVYAVWTDLGHMESHFEGKIKKVDIDNIRPAWATGIRVYEAYNGQNKGVNYLVFTGNSQTDKKVHNDSLVAVYLIANKKIDLSKDKQPKPGMGKEVILNNHVVCNPRCPDESLL